MRDESCPVSGMDLTARTRRLKRLCRRVRAAGVLSWISFRVLVRPEGCVVLVLMPALDRDSGRPIRISWKVPLEEAGDGIDALTDREIFENLRAAARDLLLHELDECLHVDGKRRWDPHAAAVGTIG